jgi:hypothetical protein
MYARVRRLGHPIGKGFLFVSARIYEGLKRKGMSKHLRGAGQKASIHDKDMITIHVKQSSSAPVWYLRYKRAIPKRSMPAYHHLDDILAF